MNCLVAAASALCLLLQAPPAGSARFDASGIPLLRAFFRQRALESYIRIDRSGTPRMVGNLYTIQRAAEAMQSEYLAEVVRILKGLKDDLASSQALRQKLLLAEAAGADRRQAEREWAGALDHFAARASKLRKLLLEPFPEFEDKGGFSPVITPRSVENSFGVEMAFMEEEVSKAERSITGYFFGRAHTVSVAELKGDDMFILLRRISEMATALRRSLEARSRARVVDGG